MQFNPLFIQPVNSGDASPKAGAGSVQKQINLNNSSYLFSDIIRIVNENLPEEQQAASSGVNDSTPAYLSVEDNFKYRMFVTLAEDSQIKDEIAAGNFNPNDIIHFDFTSATAENLKKTTTPDAKSKIGNAAQSTGKSVNVSGIESILNQLAEIFVKLGIKPDSLKLNKPITAQTDSGELNNLLQGIEQTVNSKNSKIEVNKNTGNKKDANVSESVQSVYNLLSGMLQTGSALDLSLSSNGNSVKVEIVKTDPEIPDQNVSGKIDISGKNIYQQNDSTTESVNTTRVDEENIVSKVSANPPLVKNKFTESMSSENFIKTNSAAETNGVSFNPMKSGNLSNETGSTGEPFFDFTAKGSEENAVNPASEIKQFSAQTSAQVDGAFKQAAIFSSKMNNKLYGQPAAESVQATQTSVASKTGNKFIVSVTKLVEGTQVKGSSSSLNNTKDLKSFIQEKSSGDIKINLVIRNSAQQNLIKNAVQKNETEKISVNDKAAADTPAATVPSKDDGNADSLAGKQVLLNFNHSNEAATGSNNAEIKSDAKTIEQVNAGVNSMQESDSNTQPGTSSDNTPGKGSDNNSRENQGAQLKKIELPFTVLSRDNNVESLNPVKENNIRDSATTNELPNMYKLPDAINEIKHLMTLGGTKSAVLQLKPESLGKLKITLDVTSNSVRAHVEVDNESVRQVVQNNIADLKQTLSQNGMQLNSFTVNLSSGEQKPGKFFSQKKKSNYQTIKVQAEEDRESYSTKSLGYNTYEYLA